MRGSDLPKLEDVARLAGVSTATVSRCLNSPSQVVSKTRDKVNAAIDELGYLPNSNARALAANRSNIIGAIIPTMENSIFASGLQAFQEVLNTAGFDLLVASSSYDRDTEEKQIRSLVARGAEGLFLIGTGRSAAIYDFLDNRNVPYVISWSHDASPERRDAGHFVGFNNSEAMQKITKKVIAFGHRRIAFMAGVQKDNNRSVERVSGYKKAIEEAGLSASVYESVYESSFDFDEAANVFSRIMKDANPPTAVVCNNDILAAASVLAAKQMGLCVPEDISITGFDDIQLASVVEPQLTTVRVPHHRMGAEAAKSLIGQITNAVSFENIELETRIIERGSLAPPRAIRTKT